MNLEDALGLILIASVLVISLIIKYVKYRKKMDYFRSELRRNQFLVSDTFIYKNSLVAVDEKKEKVIYMKELGRTIQYDIGVDLLIKTPSNKEIIIIDEVASRIILFFQQEWTSKVFLLNEIRKIVDYEEMNYESGNKNKVKALGLKFYFSDVEQPIVHINFISYPIDPNSERYLTMCKEIEDITETIKVILEKKIKEQKIKGGNKMTESISYNFGNVYGSMIGQQVNPSINNISDIQELDHLISTRGGDDAETLRIMISEIREMLESNRDINKSSFLKYSHIFEKHSWITGAIAQLVLNWLVKS
ncbi:hypothetical protein [Paenibacillus tengchongensis]|uniref:hypothetical protein n=1 Tax=Paenibacillus tengchongensis TaxID=2608684 RepID=UPI00124CEE39|nr:hypothetical protein [Paenibacillus tengchongensis]